MDCSAIPTLPESVRRIVVYGGLNWYGAVCAACLATSPLIRRDQAILIVGETNPSSTSFPSTGDALADPASLASSAAAANSRVRELTSVLERITASMVRGRDPDASGIPPQYYLGNAFPSAAEIPQLMGRISVSAEDNYTPDTAHDVFVVVLNREMHEDADSSVSRLMTLLQACQKAIKANNGTLPGPRVLVVADNRCRTSLSRCRDQIQAIASGCGISGGDSALSPPAATAAAAAARITYAWLGEFAPPALDFGLTEGYVRSATGNGLKGMLEQVCAGVAVGALRTLNVRRYDPTAFVPLDVALNVCLITFCQCLHPSVTPQLPTSTSSGVSVSIVLPPSQTLVWGMVSEYVMNYYGSYAKEIGAAFPVQGVLSSRPVLQFPPNVSDALNWGVDARDPLYCVEALTASRHRHKLMEGNGKLGEVMRALDASTIARAENIQRPRPLSPRRTGKREKRSSPHQSSGDAEARLFDMDADSYPVLLQRVLLGAYESRLVLQFVSLFDIDWPMYVSLVARAVLEYMAARLAPTSASTGGNNAEGLRAATQFPPQRFPTPTREFHNDLTYDATRAPRFPSLTRRLGGEVDWYFRCGMLPNGERGSMVRGMTSAHLAAILAQPDVEQLITSTALRRGVARDVVVAEARRILLRIGDTLNQLQSRTMGLLVRQMFFRVYNRVNINQQAYEKLKRLHSIPRVEVVLIPLHRSYSDFLVMTYMLAVMGHPCPHIVSGEDFLKMGAIADLMRGSGAFFMRRSFRGDPLYALLFREYVRQLVRRCLPIEFFMEGTRSRTGKTMVPKLGILKFITDAYFEEQNRVDDILFVPIGLSYDELLEAKTYADELLGIPKPPENVSNMLKATSVLNHRHGSINMDIGDPISLREFRRNPLQCPKPYTPKHSNGALPIQSSTTSMTSTKCSSGMGRDILALPKPKSFTPAPLLTSLAWHITYYLQRSIVITPPALVAAVIECFGAYCGSGPHTSEDKGTPSTTTEGSVTTTASQETSLRGCTRLSISQLWTDVWWLREHIRLRGCNMTQELATAESERLVSISLAHLSRFVRVRNNHPGDSTPCVVYEPATVASEIGVNISTNQLIHVFVDEAVIAIVAHGRGTHVEVTGVNPSSTGGNNSSIIIKGGGEARTVLGSISSFQAVRIVDTAVLTRTVHLLLHLLSCEFPNYTSASPCSFESWLVHSVSALQTTGEEERHVVEAYRAASAGDTLSSSSAASCAEDGKQKSGGTVIPSTRLYYFLVQLLFPHVEVLFVAIVSAIALLEAVSGGKVESNVASAACGDPLLPLQSVSHAMRKATRQLFSEHRLQYGTSCNKETLQHYMDALVDLSYISTARNDASEMCYARGQPSKRSVEVSGITALAPTLRDLLEFVNPMRWHPSIDVASETKVMGMVVLREYAKIAGKAKV